MKRTSAAIALLVAGWGLAACNNETPPARVGSGAGPTDNTGAPSGRVTTQDEAKQTGGG
ncbi:hypothetical protein [Aureimonas endophytica]|nr:hypothetical protein [Aureimonas endophytica]